MKLTPTSFRKWMKLHSMTIADCGLSIEMSPRNISRLLNGEWAGWGNKMAESVLEFKMKKYEESLK